MHNCSKQYSCKQTLKHHVRMHFQKRNKATCAICHRICISQESLERHVKRMHTFDTGGKRFSCNLCDAQYSHHSTLTSHIKEKHSGKESVYKCVFCSRTYHSKRGLAYHIKIKHGGKERNYHCSQCSASFITKDLLSKHLVLHGLKKFKCHHCNAAFSHLGALRTHQLIHGRSKAYECALCSLKCRHPSELKAHLKTHTKDKPIKCKQETCGKTFTEKRVMLMHWRVMHLGLGSKKCYICGVILKHRTSLKASRFFIF